MPATALVLSLICMGGGTAVVADDRTVTGDVYANVDGTRDRQFSDQVDVEITGDSGRIRLPRVVLPLVHGGAGGWFELKKLTVTDRAIEASAAVNFINRPKIHIDRLTGSISIAGKAGNYTGRCEAVDHAAQRTF